MAHKDPEMPPPTTAMRGTRAAISRWADRQTNWARRMLCRLE
eukprot:CAMPEP_0204037492 /NCGR_PEP_ID=MMETSP0360-20130528/83520_1 /ASSEMBLY_ACC=CAM_ASM_000342 /TAXON_ID=268821 /ORGANISM="Scrippsiella Hangoei, Strain SHTV-5" /LENGTH=41 /DNA_ID= /DNA_START= /DNA_END= /DNA_ORIENTATION=